MSKPQVTTLVLGTRVLLDNTRDWGRRTERHHLSLSLQCTVTESCHCVCLALVIAKENTSTHQPCTVTLAASREGGRQGGRVGEGGDLAALIGTICGVRHAISVLTIAVQLIEELRAASYWKQEPIRRNQQNDRSVNRSHVFFSSQSSCITLWCFVCLPASSAQLSMTTTL